ncbi:MAG TPA: S8 family peptidase [Symbiobacteriaceae bacterium]|jgi:serine protease AprX|nr:S8 family peptidase [Symbiobacteriaceae bacterium]
MNRSRLRVPILFLIVLLLSTFGAAANGASVKPPAATVQIDPTLPVHPLLQYGAQVQPDKRVRIIVQKEPGTSSEAVARAAGSKIQEQFPFIQGLVLEVPQRVVLALGRQKGIRYISPDNKLRHQAIGTDLLKTNYAAVVGAPSLWNSATMPATGSGVTVAVLDSGVNPNHPDFSGGGLTAVLGNGKAKKYDDANGHGTHVVGIIRSRDPQGRYIGVAPEATVISLKIADDEGKSTEVDLIRGLQWVYANRTRYNIRVVNLSVSGSVPMSFLDSPISAAGEQLWNSGIVVVTASGNRGPGDTTAWYAPANDPHFIAVGALDHQNTVDRADDMIAPFSTRGTTQNGYYRPDVVAPGRRIVSALAGPTSTLGLTFPDRITDTNYIRLSGTSMAAPVVAGVAALILEKYPALTPDQVKWLLVNTATAYPGMPDNAGIVDAPNAMVRAAAGSVPAANLDLPFNRFISNSTGTTQWAQTYWDQTYWDQTYWDQAYWDSNAGYEQADYDYADAD